MNTSFACDSDYLLVMTFSWHILEVVEAHAADAAPFLPLEDTAWPTPSPERSLLISTAQRSAVFGMSGGQKLGVIG